MSETGTAAAAPPTSTAVAPAGAPAPSKTGPETVVTDAPTTEAPTEEAYRKAKHRVVLDGKDSEVDYDELVRGYQRAKVGHARLEEAARREKQVQAHSAQVERVLAAMESGDVRIARETFGPKWREIILAEAKRIEAEDALPPEQREASDWERRRDAAKRELEEIEAKRNEATLAEKATVIQAQLTAEFGEAIKDVGLKATPRRIARMSSIAESVWGAGVRSTPAELAAVLRDEEADDLGSTLDGDMPEGDALPEWIAKRPGLIERVRKYLAGQVTATKRVAAAPSPPAEPKPAEKITIDHLRAQPSKRRP